MRSAGGAFGVTASARAPWKARVAALAAGVAAGAGGCHGYQAFEWLYEALPCEGACVPLRLQGYDAPVVLWMGDQANAPRCEDWGAGLVAEGRADPNAAFDCPACECSPPVCQLPEEIGTSVAPLCDREQRTMETPAGWDGSCFAAAEPLSGVRSIEVTTAPGGCREIGEAFVKPEPKWGTFGRACRAAEPTGVCSEPGYTCLAGAGDPDPGVRVCIAPFHGEECPEHRYTEKVVLYAAAEDTRSCTACRCEESGAECTARVTAHSDAMCTELALSFPVSVQGACHSLTSAPPITVASMEAAWLVNEPGACALVPSQPSGEVVPTEPFTYCCAPKLNDGE